MLDVSATLKPLGPVAAGELYASWRPSAVLQNERNVYKTAQQIDDMEPQIQIFVKDLLSIHRKSFNVNRGGVSRYLITNPGVWKTYVNDGLNLRTEIENHLLVVNDEMVIDGRQIESLCWKSRRGQRCLSSSGVKVRIGAIILAHYSIIDQLATACNVKKMLYYINNVERNPDVAEFAVKVLMAKNTLGDDEALVKAILSEISKIRLAKYARI